MNIDLNKVRAVVFDFDGTIYNNLRFPMRLIFSRLSDIFVMQAERKVRKQMQGLDLESEEAFMSAFYSHMAEKSSLTEEEAEKWYWEEYMELFQKVLRKYYQPNENVVEVFEKLNEMEIPVAIYSDYPMVRERLEALGLPADLCDNCWSAPELGALKPAVRPMHEIAAALGVAPEEMLVVGDRVDTDGKSAFLCGAQFVRVLKKKNQKDDSKEYASMQWSVFADYLLNFKK